MTNFLTPSEAAQRLNVSPKTVLRAVRRGDLQAVRIGRLWRVLLPEVAA